MLRWSIAFLLLAIIAAFFGYGNIAHTSVEIAQVLFFLFAILFVVSAVAGALRGKMPS